MNDIRFQLQSAELGNSFRSSYFFFGLIHRSSLFSVYRVMPAKTRFACSQYTRTNYFFAPRCSAIALLFLTGIIGTQCRILIRLAFLLNENVVSLRNELISRVLNAPHKTRDRLVKIYDCCRIIRALFAEANEISKYNEIYIYIYKKMKKRIQTTIIRRAKRAIIIFTADKTAVFPENREFIVS